MKQLMVARTFPSTHVLKGQQTYFVEKISASLGIDCWLDHPYAVLNDFEGAADENTVMEFQEKLLPNAFDPKIHTVRKGKCWQNGKERKTGDIVQLKAWSGKPYRSKTITITPPLTLTVYDIDIVYIPNTINVDIEIEGKPFCRAFTSEGNYTTEFERLAKNDGLSASDMFDWFIPNPTKFESFQGQILAWGDVKY